MGSGVKGEHHYHHHHHHYHHRGLPSSAFCLSAPSEVIQSDLGLYGGHRGGPVAGGGEGGVAGVGSGLSHCRINSPSESSGYFGSNCSSLGNSSRMSSGQQISLSLNTPTSNSQLHHTLGPSSSHTFGRPSDVCEGEEEDREEEEEADLSTPTSSQSAQSALTYQQRFYSLQRRPDLPRGGMASSSGTGGGLYYTTHRHPPSSTGHVQLRGGVASSHYGTAPRVHRTVHGVQSAGTTDPDPFRRSHHDLVDQDPPPHRRHAPHSGHTHPSHHHHYQHHPHEPLASQTGNTSQQNKKEKRGSRMNFDQFRTSLSLLVNPADPRRLYADFAKIGEGSTGNVYMATHLPSRQVVAIKKMNLWKQQKRELLFNEVS